MASSAPHGGAWRAEGNNGGTQGGTAQRKNEHHAISGIAIEKGKEMVGGGIREPRGRGGGRGWVEAGIC